MKKKAQVNNLTYGLIALVVIIVIFLVVFIPMLPKLARSGIITSSGSEEDCKAAMGKFPVYDSKNEYYFCSSCLDYCDEYKQEDMCKNVDSEKCDFKCVWQSGFPTGTCAETQDNLA
ncbi:MAG: hypothetical protein Q8O89_05110 [Nanoarchaeota archaeon]|nr:hypothetical protein [Nanoarchaeota archaeon]